MKLTKLKFANTEFTNWSNRKNAFTLAEVLITLGIIGIVAAMTLPALIQKNKKIEASSRIKKFYSVMSQAILMSVNENGDAKYWQHQKSIRDEDGNYDDEQNKQETQNFWNMYLKKYMKTGIISESETTIEGDNDIRNVFKVSFSDGSVVYLRNGDCVDMIYDYNGDKAPNKNGSDRFVFLIYPENNKLGTNGQDSLETRDVAYNVCKANSYRCSRLLQIDNWEFKDDYPHKI